VYNYVCKSIDGNTTRALRKRCTDLLLFSGGVFISFAQSHLELTIIVLQQLFVIIVNMKNRFDLNCI